MRLGLKLWSNNTENYLKEAQRLYKQGWFDYIELYIIPDSLDIIKSWEKLDIPFTLHATHLVHGVNLAQRELESDNLRIFKQVKVFLNALNAEYVVVHSGTNGNIEETVRQLKKINLEKLLIENKPYIAPLKPEWFCRGATIEEISFVMKEINCGFCLDVGHALCSANSMKIDNYEYLEQFQKLNPTCYHLSDNFIDSELDKHLHLGQGNYDFKKIFDIMDSEKNVAIETNKDSKENLDDFIEDVKWIKTLKA